MMPDADSVLVPASDLRAGDWVWHRRLECWRHVVWVRCSGTALVQFGFGDGRVGAAHRDTRFRVRADRPERDQTAPHSCDEPRVAAHGPSTDTGAISAATGR